MMSWQTIRGCVALFLSLCLLLSFGVIAEETVESDAGGDEIYAAGEEHILIPVVNEFLSLRAAPSTQAAVLEKILPEMTMILLREEAGFYYVRVVETGSEGYVNPDYVADLARVGAPEEEYVDLSDEDEPSAEELRAETEMTIPETEPVIPTDETLAEEDTGDAAVQSDETILVPMVSEYLNLRAAPSTKAAVIEKVTNEKSMILLREEEGFYYVRVVETGNEGYVNPEYVRARGANVGGGMPAQPSVPTVIEQPSGAENETILAPQVSEYLSLRAAPSTQASVIEKVTREKTMILLREERGFYYVRVVQTGNEGYVNPDYVRTVLRDGEVVRWPYSYSNLMTELKALEEKVGDILTIDTLCTTLDGREVPLILFGRKDAQKHILIQSSMHGREYVVSMLTMDLLNELMTQYPNGVDGVMFHIVPMTNPDGVVISHEGASGIRDPQLAATVREYLAKSKDPYTMWKANARGTDLNRNFPEEWESLTGREPGSMRYRGPYPLSEPESIALAEYMDNHPIDATISYHTHGNVVYWEGAYTQELKERNKSFARVICDMTGYKIGANEKGIVERGGFKDWTVGTRALPSLTIEVGGKTCFCSEKEYPDILRRHSGTWYAMAQWVLANT